MEKEIILPAAINILYNKSSKNYQYRLIIYNSKLSRMLYSKRERAKLIKKEGFFYLIKDTSGNVLSAFPKNRYLFMSIGKIPFRDIYLKSKDKSNTIKIKLRLNPDDWGLDSLDIFLAAKEERELAEKLISLGFNVTPITYNDKDKLINACADLLITNGQMKIPIEITITSPSNRDIEAGVNSPHGHQWSKVAGRILPLLMYSSENNSPSFFIINDKWEKYNHVNYFIEKLKKSKCFVFSSNFSGDWSNDIAKKIYKEIYN